MTTRSKKMKKVTKRINLLLALLLVVSIITGCTPASTSTSTPPSSAETSNPPATSTTSPSAPSTTSPDVTPDNSYDTPINIKQGIDHKKKEIYIGTTYVTSGVYAFIGIPVIEAIKATFARINEEEGGIHGYKLVLVNYDGQNNPGEDQALLERLVEEDKVYMMTFLTGNQVNTSMNYIVEYGVPVFYVSSGLKETFNAGPNVFPMQPAFISDGKQLAARVLHESVFGPNGDQKLKPGEKIGIVYINAPGGQQPLSGMEEIMKAQGRWDDCIVEGVEGVQAGQVEAAIQKMKESGVSVLVFLGTGPSAAYAACDDIGLEVPFFSTYSNSGTTSWPADFYKESRPIYVTGWADYTTEKAAIGLEVFYQTMEYSSLSKAEIEGLKEDFYARAGFCAGLMIEQGLKRMAANGPDWSWEALIAAMEQEPVEMITKESADYSNGVRWGMTMEGMGKYYRDPEDPSKIIADLIFPFETVEDILKK